MMIQRVLMMKMTRPRFSMRCDCVVTSFSSIIEFIRIEARAWCQGPRPPSDAGLNLLTSAGHLYHASFDVQATAWSPTR